MLKIPHHTEVNTTQSLTAAGLLIPIASRMPIEIRKGMVLPPIYPIAYPQEDTLSIRPRVVTSVRKES